MKLNIWKNQTEIEKTYEVEAYDLMYGTVEDILDILDGVSDDMSNDSLIALLGKSMPKVNGLILDIFPEATEDDLKKVKVKELVPVFLEVFGYVRETFSESQGKN